METEPPILHDADTVKAAIVPFGKGLGISLRQPPFRFHARRKTSIFVHSLGLRL